MTEPTPTSEASSPNAVDTSSVGLLTIDTGSQAVTACDDAIAEMVGRTAGDVLGRPLSDLVGDEVRPIATAVLDGIRAGFISSVDGNVDLSGPGGPVAVDCWILALGDGRPCPKAIAGAVPTDGAAYPAAADSRSGFRPARVDPGRILLATLDEDWAIVDVAPGSASRLGLPGPRPGTAMPRLHDLAHPGDLSALDAPFARRSSAAGRDTFSLRLRGPDRQWCPTRVTVSPLRGALSAKYALVVRLLPGENDGEVASERVARLEDQLARIRQVVQAPDGHGPSGSVDLGDLTTRQREIVQRLLGGHRVDAIARDLFVSPSTVRNHLSAIFEKLGVASQSELVELLRRDGSAGPKIESGAV